MVRLFLKKTISFILIFICLSLICYLLFFQQPNIIKPSFKNNPIVLPTISLKDSLAKADSIRRHYNELITK
ncbi:MAG: hypothetical protein Q8L04_10545, partial [Ignavibacteria bacterium]|nr:hypothetical protein [Ignavibacteria bacterium]